MWSFAAPSGEFDTMIEGRGANRIGLTGGILKVGEECKGGELKNGMGVTIYHFVENIEEVCAFSSMEDTS